LYLEDQRGPGRNVVPCSALAVAQLGRQHQLGLTAFVHELQAFGPARDHTVQRKADRLPTEGRVELGAVDQLAAVVHGHRVAGAGLTPFSDDLVTDLQARTRDFDAVFLGVLIEIGFLLAHVAVLRV